ncbi:MAG: hypothetical protein ACYCPS_01295 [Candidatus Saccharimonadales bacterium]
MRKHLIKLGIISSALALAVIGGSVVFALPPQANAHAQNSGNPGYGSINNPGSHTPNTGNQGPNQASNGQSHLAAAQLNACQNRENAINNIMSRIDTRAQNQINLFSTIATRVENFYTSKGKTLSNYNQLVSAVNAAKTQAETDFGTLKTNSTFSCSDNNPKGMVTAFQGYLKTEISDLQNYRTAVKNLIVGVASANGVTVSGSSQSTSHGGQ